MIAVGLPIIVVAALLLLFLAIEWACDRLTKAAIRYINRKAAEVRAERDAIIADKCTKEQGDD